MNKMLANFIKSVALIGCLLGTLSFVGCGGGRPAAAAGMTVLYNEGAVAIGAGAWGFSKGDPSLPLAAAIVHAVHGITDFPATAFMNSGLPHTGWPAANPATHIYHLGSEPRGMMAVYDPMPAAGAVIGMEVVSARTTTGIIYIEWENLNDYITTGALNNSINDLAACLIAHQLGRLLDFPNNPVAMSVMNPHISVLDAEITLQRVVNPVWMPTFP